MSNFNTLILDYANFSTSSIPISFLAIKLNKTTREIKFLKNSEPWKYQEYLNQYQKQINFIKPIEYPPLPYQWYQKFLQSGGLTMLNGDSLPTLKTLNNQNNVF